MSTNPIFANLWYVKGVLLELKLRYWKPTQPFKPKYFHTQPVQWRWESQFRVLRSVQRGRHACRASMFVKQDIVKTRGNFAKTIFKVQFFSKGSKLTLYLGQTYKCTYEQLLVYLPRLEMVTSFSCDAKNLFGECQLLLLVIKSIWQNLFTSARTTPKNARGKQKTICVVLASWTVVFIVVVPQSWRYFRLFENGQTLILAFSVNFFGDF